MSADRFVRQKKEEDFISHDEEENEDNETNKMSRLLRQKIQDSFEMKEEVEFKIFVCDDEEWGS